MTNLAATCLLALARRVQRGGIIVNEHILSVAQTRLHVQVLSRWFDFVSLADLPHRLATPAAKPFCLMTFDDGKRSNFTEVAPELERLRVPAVFYVTTGFLTSGLPLWFDRWEQLRRALGYCPQGLELHTLKHLPHDSLRQRLERACAGHELESAPLSPDAVPMSWNEVRNLNERGFTIGAHGVTHAILTRETRKRAFAEIEESLATVSREVGQPCRTFAFPNGNYNTDLAQHARHCGTTTVMTTDPMWVDNSVSLWSLPRIQLFGNFSRARIESKIALASLRGVLANPDGTGREYLFGRTPAFARSVSFQS